MTDVDVAVVGTVNLDHTVRVPRLPERGETVVGGEVTTAPGGKGVNQAVAAARLGARTALVGCVGDDAAGATVLEFLTAEPRLDLRCLRRVPGPTGYAFVTVDAAGGNMIVSSPGANRALDEAHVHRCGRVIADAAVLLVQLGVPVGAVTAALEIARSVGTVTVLDPSPPDEVTDELLRLVDVLVPNQSEAARLTGLPVRDLEGAEGARAAATALVRRGCASVVVTMAERGAWYASGEGVMRSVAPYAVDVVDPTGAGDAFCGALAAGLARGQPILEALGDAAAAGALATTRLGAGPSLPGLASVARLRAGGAAAGRNSPEEDGPRGP